jgi:hypothetical protein
LLSQNKEKEKRVIELIIAKQRTSISKMKKKAKACGRTC